MEQQTISVAKAGISTVLNSRAAVIAAANPKFGSFDDQKDPQENIEFQSTILSRFDAIFIVLDERNEEKDTHLSKHVMNMHAKAAAPGAAPGTHRHALRSLSSCHCHDSHRCHHLRFARLGGRCKI